MTLPSVTALCCTYGRSGLLEESIESFILQDYAGEKELVVLNDLKCQTLMLADCPANIRIVNVDTRFPNLGAKRNAVASFAQTEIIISWDDDDIYLPHRISANITAWKPRTFVTESDGWFFYNKPRMKYERGTHCGPFLMARKDYWNLGGIPDADVGEDQQFIAAVRKSLKVVPSVAPSDIYRWSTGRYHISEHGFNNGAWKKVEAQVHASLANGREPSGQVILHPQWHEDYEALAHAAINTNA